MKVIKDFDDYEILDKDEYNDYLDGFFELLNKIKDIRNSSR